MTFKEIKIVRSPKDYVKGTSVIPYFVNFPNGDSSQYFSPFTPQRYGLWDSDDCWDDSSCAVVQAELNYLMATGQLSPQAISWYTANGYIVNGQFKISFRYLAILSGARDNGNDPINFCKLFSQYGFIPLSDLDFSDGESDQYPTQQAFDNDFFNGSIITPAMQAKGIQALSFINFQYQFLEKYGGTEPSIPVVQAALCQYPVVITIPVPQPETLWNSPIVPVQAGNTILRHAVALSSINSDNSYKIHDNYAPEWKTLATGYYIGEVIQIVITSVIGAAPNPNPQQWWNILWQQVFNFLAGLTGQKTV
jgi:hypothetical protein